MQITAVRCVSLVRRLDRPQANSCGARREREFSLVAVETDVGLTGLGDAFGDSALVEPIVQRRLARMVVGSDPTDIDGVWRKMFASRAFWETGGTPLCVMSAIEVACWDLWAQAEGVAVCELLGGRRRDWIPAYASDLHWDEPGYMAERAAEYAAAGYKAVKSHLGAAGERDRDLERCRAIGDAIGPGVRHMIDVNTAFDRPTALVRGREFADFNPYWYEEPLNPLDYRGHAWLREHLPTPLATGENLYTMHGFEPLLHARGCDFLMPDILRCGGLEQTRLICELARRQGVVATPHNYSSGVGLAATLHLMAALPETDWLEYDPTGTAVYDELFHEPPAVSGGLVRVPGGPGLGVRLTPEIVARYG